CQSHYSVLILVFIFFFQAEDGIRDFHVTGVQTCALPISIVKGVSHIVGLVRLLALIARRKPDVVHVQWVVLPLIDVPALWLIRMRRPLILTVHDPTPYNGQRMSLLQRLGFDIPIRLADRVIVHTRSGRDALIARGVAPERIAVIPHGPLPLKAAPRPRTGPHDPRYTFVLFG